MFSPPVILYRYDPSPYCRKIDNVLALKRIPYQTVTVSRILPRPQISELLGIAYRRSPILAIGNDVYCDTSLITTVLERRFPPSQRYGTLFPPLEADNKCSNTGLIKAFSKFYAESALQLPVVGLIPWAAGIPPEVLKDRSELVGGTIDPEKLSTQAPLAASALATHLDLVEEQLADGRKYLFATTDPSLADISVHFILEWARRLPGSEAIFAPAPMTVKWVERVTVHLNVLRELNSLHQDISGSQAADSIIAADYEPLDIVGFDNVESERLGVKKGMEVKVTPDDTGRNHPTIGTLVALNRQELTLEVNLKSGAGKEVVRVHFPRLQFTVVSA